MKTHIITLLFCLIPFAAMGQGSEEVSMSADRPGMATGPDVLGFGGVQWETGFQGDFVDGFNSVTLPTTLFRFGVAPFAELRLQYDGALNNLGEEKWQYSVLPMTVGTKIRVFDGSDEKGLRWIPKTSVMVNLAIPLTKELADEMYVAPSAYLLFNNEVSSWFNISYNVGAEWNGADAVPDIFFGLCLGFNITENFGAFLESYNYFTCQRGEKCVADANLDFGFSYQVHPRVQLDLYGAFNCQDPKSYSNVGLGVAWLINAPKK